MMFILIKVGIIYVNVKLSLHLAATIRTNSYNETVIVTHLFCCDNESNINWTNSCTFHIFVEHWVITLCGLDTADELLNQVTSNEAAYESQTKIVVPLFDFLRNFPTLGKNKVHIILK